MEEPRMLNSFVGNYTCTLDSKGKIMVPAKFRHAIPSELKETLIVSKGKDRCLNLYPMSHWNMIMKELSALPPGPKRRNLIRFYSDTSHQVNIDRSGRIAIPANYLEMLGKPKQVIVVGALTYMEIWDPGNYEKMKEEAAKTYMESDWEL